MCKGGGSTCRAATRGAAGALVVVQGSNDGRAAASSNSRAAAGRTHGIAAMASCLASHARALMPRVGVMPRHCVVTIEHAHTLPAREHVHSHAHTRTQSHTRIHTSAAQAECKLQTRMNIVSGKHALKWHMRANYCTNTMSLEVRLRV